MKDRMALAMIARAEADGRRSPGGTVIEYTVGLEYLRTDVYRRG